MTKPVIVAICGKGCSGKDTLLKELGSGIPHLVSCTTRPPREGEKEGEDYYFVPPSFFEDHDMLTSTIFKGKWRYGIAIEKLNPIANLCIANNEEIKQLAAKQGEFIVVPIVLECSWRERVRRSKTCRQGWERYRRLLADSVEWVGFIDFVLDNFRYRLVLDGEHSPWYNAQILKNYLGNFVLPSPSNFDINIPNQERG